MSQAAHTSASGVRWQVHQLPRIAEEAVARARLSVVPRRRNAPPRLPFVTLVSLVLLAGVVGLLCLNTSMQQSSFAQTKLDSEATQLAAVQQQLLTSVQSLQSPQRIGEFAQSRRGGRMVQPTGTCQLELATAKVSGCPAAAALDPATQRVRLFPRAPHVPHL